MSRANIREQLNKALHAAVFCGTADLSRAYSALLAIDSAMTDAAWAPLRTDADLGPNVDTVERIRGLMRATPAGLDATSQVQSLSNNDRHALGGALVSLFEQLVEDT